jgi:hypothetical protein
MALLAFLGLYSENVMAAASDFKVVDIKLSPANPNPGDNVTFTMTVQNMGGATQQGAQLSGAFFVNGIKTSWSTGNGNTASLPQGGYRDLIADGGPYGTSLYKWGNYKQTITAVVNDANRIYESNTGNNTFDKVVDIAPASDFKVVDIKLSPANPKPGDNVVFTMTVQNMGGATATGSQLSGAFFVNGIKTSWSTGNGNTASLPQGGYRDLIADGGPYGNSVVYKWGDYKQTVTAYVNDANRIYESNTGNNTFDKTFTGKKMFYGINGHPAPFYPLSDADTLKILKNLGVSQYRINTGTTDGTIKEAVRLTKYLMANGIQVLPVLDCGIMGNPGDENGAYSAAYNLAVKMVLAFAGTGIKVYEVGNELDRKPEVFNNPYAGGNNRYDYYKSGMPAYRGTIRGLIDGVHAAQWDAKAGVNFYGADIAAADMLWYGIDPDDSTGHKVARWDITMWHIYEINLSIFNAGVDGGGTANPPLNVPEYVKRYNNNPFWLTEFGPNHEDPQDQKVKYLNATLSDLYNNRNNSNIAAVFVYQLDGDFGMIVNDRAVPLTFYPYFYTFQSFIATHPE